MGQSVLMRAIPLPMRRRILQLYERDKSTREIAEFLGFCVAAVRRVRQQFRQRGTLQPQTHLCGRKTLLTDRKSTRLNSSHANISYAVFCLKKKEKYSLSEAIT